MTISVYGDGGWNDVAVYLAADGSLVDAGGRALDLPHENHVRAALELEAVPPHPMRRRSTRAGIAPPAV